MNDSSAVKNQRRKRISDGEPWQDLDFLPTPPWATRALVVHVLPKLRIANLGIVREPCAGLRHMADPLAEYARQVRASDVYLYDRTLDVEQLDCLGDETPADDEWWISNPPYKIAQQVVFRALARATVGVAMLLRFNWLEGADRYRELFSILSPALVAVFSERVPMCEGGYDPELSSATCYAWFVWVRDRDGWQKPARMGVGHFDGFIIPPVCKATLFRPDDAIILANRHAPGWISPRLLKKHGAQIAMEMS